MRLTTDTTVYAGAACEAGGKGGCWSGWIVEVLWVREGKWDVGLKVPSGGWLFWMLVFGGISDNDRDLYLL